MQLPKQSRSSILLLGQGLYAKLADTATKDAESAALVAAAKEEESAGWIVKMRIIKLSRNVASRTL